MKGKETKEKNVEKGWRMEGRQLMCAGGGTRDGERKKRMRKRKRQKVGVV